MKTLIPGTRGGSFLLLAALLILSIPPLVLGDSGRGAAIYSANCTSCHGVRGDGKGPGARAINPPPPDFTDAGFWKGKTDSYLTHVIQNGMGPMPAWSDLLSPEKIDDVLTYIKTFRK